MRSSWVSVGPKSSDRCCYERRRRQERRTHRTENKTDVDVKAEAGLTQLQAKERLEPPEAGRGS